MGNTQKCIFYIAHIIVKSSRHSNNTLYDQYGSVTRDHIITMLDHMIPVVVVVTPKVVHLLDSYKYHRDTVLIR